MTPRGSLNPPIARGLTVRQVDHAQTVVAELGDKQPPALHIDPEVIDPAAHLAERDLCLEHEGHPRSAP
jgi:hypothetical protein